MYCIKLQLSMPNITLAEKLLLLFVANDLKYRRTLFKKENYFRSLQMLRL